METVSEHVDLRSDTVTLPDSEMREAMANAPVGDDVFGEDPTVNRLEEEAAALLGKEASLYLPSGTMANLAAVLAHTRRGDAVLVDPESHIFYYEAGGTSLFGGNQLWPVDELHAGRGVEMLQKAIRPPNIHFAPPALLCLENTHNRRGGTVLSPEEQDALYAAAREYGLLLHLDGARIFNAAVAQGLAAALYTRSCDSVMFSLSKGLGAPAGSILAGSSSFIQEAKRYRKALGGGMRQIGILAAAGLVALERRHELEEDHRRAQELARGLIQLPGLIIDPYPPPTNMVMLHTLESGLYAADAVEGFSELGIKTLPFGEHTIRLVVHRNISDEGVEKTLQAAASVFERQR